MPHYLILRTLCEKIVDLGPAPEDEKALMSIVFDRHLKSSALMASKIVTNIYSYLMNRPDEVVRMCKKYHQPFPDLNALLSQTEITLENSLFRDGEGFFDCMANLFAKYKWEKLRHI